MTAGRKSTGAKNNSYGKSYRDEDRHLIENYAEASKSEFKGWIIIHRLEYDENWNRVRSKQDLKDAGLYYNRPATELKYIRMTEYFKLNPVSNELKKHLSEQKKGSNNYWHGKSLSLETRAKISARKRLPNLAISYSKNPNEKNASEYLEAFSVAYPEYVKYLNPKKVG